MAQTEQKTRDKTITVCLKHAGELNLPQDAAFVYAVIVDELCDTIADTVIEGLMSLTTASKFINAIQTSTDAILKRRFSECEMPS